MDQPTVTRIAARYFRRVAGPLTDVSKLRHQAVFMMGAGGSGKGYASHKWLKYMPGGGSGGVDRKRFEQSEGQLVSDERRSLNNVKFNKAVAQLKQQGFEIDIAPGGKGQVPFKLYTYDSGGAETEVLPSTWRESLPPEIYREVKGIENLIFSSPKNELPSYWRQINPDIYKEEIPGYSPSQPGFVHEMSSLMNKAHFIAALETGDPLFIDGTGSNMRKMSKWVQQAQQAGYRVSVVFVFVPLVVNQIRNATRARKVPAPVVTGQWGKIKSNFAALRTMADKAHVIVNRNDAHDVKNWKKHGQEIDRFVSTTYNGKYTDLAHLIRDVAPSEYKEWASKLKW